MGTSFHRFHRQYLQALVPPEQEFVLAGVFQAALKAGLDVRVLPFERGEYIDMGTLEALAYAIDRFSK